VNGIVDISSGFEIKVATASSAGRGKVTAFLGTSYKRLRPPLSSAPPRGREYAVEWSDPCLTIQSRLTKPRFFGAERRVLMSAATRERTTALERI